jgi:hypothetical protein
MSGRRNWRAVRLRTLCRAEVAGWSWGRDPRAAGRLVLVSPRGTVFELRCHPIGTQARQYAAPELALEA